MKSRIVSELLMFALVLFGLPLVSVSAQIGRLQVSDLKNLASAPAQQEKFALLVGVNSYPNLPAHKQLTAPENDAALMKELLVKRYGFVDDPAHMKVLLSKNATRKAITDAFNTHLVEKAKQAKGAIVVFYFSGHGSHTKDLNDDEGDSRDETIVPSDSRDGRVTDILDDEINEWFETLQRHTSNITFILDSCHSGSGTKTIDPEVKAKELEPDTQPQPQQKKLPAGGAKSKDLGNGILSRNDSYVTISGCLPSELSYEGSFEINSVSQRRSYMTHYLVQILERRPTISYREAVDQVSKEVSGIISQHPQVEGNIGRSVFGSSSDSEDPFIKFSAKPSGRKVFIAAGTAHTVREGTIIAIYKPEAKKLVGEKPFKIANARVTKANELDSVAEMPAAPTQPVPENAKVVIVTPGLGVDRLSVLVSPTSLPAASLPEAAYAQKVQDALSAESLRGLVEVVMPGAGGKPWDFALLKGAFKDVKMSMNHVPAEFSDNDTVYYFATRGADRPLFDLLVTANDQSGPRRLADALGKKARQDKLRALYNAASPLNNKVSLTLTRVFIEQNPDCSAKLGANGKPIVLREEVVPPSQSGIQSFSLCDRFKFVIKNGSDKDVYVTLFFMGAGGSIGLLTPDRDGKLVTPNESFTTDVFSIGPPKGLETYKLIATTGPSDFKFLAQPGAKLLKDYSPLDLLVDLAYSGRSKDPGRETGFDLSSWTVGQMDFMIK